MGLQRGSDQGAEDCRQGRWTQDQTEEGLKGFQQETELLAVRGGGAAV